MKKGKFVVKEAWDKQKVEGRCVKCGRINYQARDGKPTSRAKTLPSASNAH